MDFLPLSPMYPFQKNKSRVYSADVGAIASHTEGTAPKLLDMKTIWGEKNADIRYLKFILLLGMRGMYAYAYHAKILSYSDNKINTFLLFNQRFERSYLS